MNLTRILDQSNVLIRSDTLVEVFGLNHTQIRIRYVFDTKCDSTWLNLGNLESKCEVGLYKGWDHLIMGYFDNINNKF
jgi:hypothetical protein